MKTLDNIELAQVLHRIKESPDSEGQEKAQDSLVIPYSPLPFEILSEDNKCDVHLFAAGITTWVNEFIREANKTEGHVRLTELEWLSKFSQFMKKKDAKR